MLFPLGLFNETCWLNSWETLLYQGHADKLADELVKAAPCKGASNSQALLTSADYFCTNHHRMNYIEISEEEWPIGNGNADLLRTLISNGLPVLLDRPAATQAVVPVRPPRSIPGCGPSPGYSGTD